MKKIIITLIGMLPVLGIGQTTTENYVKTMAYQVATETDNVSEEQKIESITYFDGLGRAKQSIAVKAGGDKENIVSHTEYDALGRSPKQYLPLATAPEIPNPLDFTSSQTIKTEIGIFYNTPKYEDAQNPYSQTVYEASGLGRVFEQASPGNSWALSEGHTVKMDYQVNLDDEVYYYNVMFSGGDTALPELTLNGFYGESELRKNVTKDENWTSTSGNNHTTEEFTNKLGQVVLKRTYNTNIAHNTYYVYDDFGNLTFVLSPEASDQIVSNNTLVNNYQDILDKLGYQYTYDYHNRLIEKKIPAKGWEYIVYNLLDQPVLTQDARLRESNQWLFTKYDALQRVVYTGFIINGGSRLALQNYANNTEVYPSVFEHRVDNQNNIAGTAMYYSRQSFPTGTISKILTINYYDTYVDMAGLNLPDIVYGQNVTNITQGLPTVSKVRILDTDNWITSVTGYDEKARPVFGASLNTYLGTQDISESLLDFTGKVLESRTTHQKTGHQEIVTKDYLTYDHQNRLITHMQQIDSEPLQLIASNTSDELGQLESKRVGGQLFEIGYADLVKVSVSDDGSVIAKTDPEDEDSYNAGLATIGKLEGDGGLSFSVESIGAELRVGFNDINVDEGVYDINYFYRFLTTLVNGKYRYIIYKRPLAGGGAEPLYTGYYDIDSNDFKIERDGDTLHFIQNEAVVIVTQLEDPSIALIGDISFKTPSSQISNLNLYTTTIDKSLQKVDYQYNVRGWLTDINPIGAAAKEMDLFQFKINYDDAVEGDAGIAGRAVPLYNGNISQTTWQTANSDTKKRTYGYKYDDLNRVKVAYSRKGVDLTEYDHFNVSGIDYDKNGNILTLIRQGENENHNALNMDDLSYAYDGNQLLGVTDSSTSGIKHKGFYDGNTSGNDYIYDVNGNMTADKNKGITTIDYNHLNLPIFINISGTDAYNNLQKGNISYIYDATGVKQAKVVQDNAHNITVTTSYAGAYIYENNDGLEKLKMISHPEGYIEPVHNTTKSVKTFNKETQTTSFSEYQYAFNYTDHLGNVRLTYSDANGDGAIEKATEIISEKHYYPFGLQQRGYNDLVTSNVNSVANRFGFGNKELGDELGLDWYDISARNYDPAIGRWMNIDPLAEAMRRHSPYNYAFDNPVYYIDPDGMAPTGPPDDIYLDGDGKEIHRVENDQPDKTFLVKTSKKTNNKDNSGVANTNPISSKDRKNTEKQIKNGNLEGPHMNNVVQIENAETQKDMLDFVKSKDDGKGENVKINLSAGTVSERNLDNFTEHGGNIEDGQVTNTRSGSPSTPGISAKAQMDGDVDFHSHPSGKSTITNADGTTTNGYTSQFPSRDDVINAQRTGKTKYQFSMGSKKVHIYDGTGVIGIIPFKNFGKIK